MASWVMQLTADWNNTTGNFETNGTWLKDGAVTTAPTGNNPVSIGDTVNWGVAIANLPTNGFLSQLVVTTGKFQGNNPSGSMASPFRTGGGPMCLIEEVANPNLPWGNPATGYQGFATSAGVNQDPNNKGARSKYEFTLVAIWGDGAGNFREYGCDPEIDVDNGM